jgi:hypothetical protein
LERVGGFEACLSINALDVIEKCGLPGAITTVSVALDVVERFEKHVRVLLLLQILPKSFDFLQQITEKLHRLM